jgi:hypothetical protein
MSSGCFTQNQIFTAAQAGEDTHPNPWMCRCAGVGFFSSNVDTFHACRFHGGATAASWIFMETPAERNSFEWTEEDEQEWKRFEKEQHDKNQQKKRQFWGKQFKEQRKRANMDFSEEQRDGFKDECARVIKRKGINPEDITMSDWVGAAWTIADREFWPI